MKIAEKSTMQNLNGDLYREQAVFYKSATKQMLRALIKKTPREIILDVLVSEKIIKRDWGRRGNKYSQNVQDASFTSKENSSQQPRIKQDSGGKS